MHLLFLAQSRPSLPSSQKSGMETHSPVQVWGVGPSLALPFSLRFLPLLDWRGAVSDKLVVGESLASDMNRVIYMKEQQ